MARIPIYDSAAIIDSDGAVITTQLAYLTYRRSKCIRLSGIPQQLLYVSYEWQVDCDAAGAWEFLWYQEFWGDTAGWEAYIGHGAQPSTRLAPGLLPDGPWPREVIGVITDATNIIDTSNLTRKMIFNPSLNSPDAKWLTLGNFAPYVRLAIALNTDPAAGQAGVRTLPRLRVWAHVAGYEGKQFDAMTAPFAQVA